MPGPGIPTIQWGTFYDKSGIVHIAPVVDDGYLMKGHKLTTSCACGPRMEKTRDSFMVVHYVIH